MKKMLIAAGLLGAMPALAAAAQDKPAPEEAAPLNPLAGPEAPLTAKERRGLTYGRQWANNRDQPARGKDGSAVFVFGATLPTVVCAPLYVCDFVLEAGETVNDLHVGDAVRWQIAPATQGAGETLITHIIIKPTDIGLTTNMLVMTNRRAYTVKLVSRSDAWMPRISFQYPDAMQVSWGAYRHQQEQRREEAEAEAATEAIGSRVDFTYAISGEARWRPVRAYASGGKTIIQFPRTIGEADLPALVALADEEAGLLSLFSEPDKELVNYRFVKGRFIVDKVLNRAALISGVGSGQLKVELQRQEKAQ